MKSERRHELQESELVHALESGKAVFEEHGKTIGIVVLAAVALIVVMNVVSSAREADATERFQRLSMLAFNTPEEKTESFQKLMALSQEASTQSLAIRTLSMRGSQALRSATEGENVDRNMNEVARESFARLLNAHGSNTVAAGIARLGIATCEENAFVLDGDTAHKEVAREHLEAIINNEQMHTLPFYALALERKESLDHVFSSVAFDPAPAEEEGSADAGTGGAIQPVVISPDGQPGDSPIKVETIEAVPVETKPVGEPEFADEAGSEGSSETDDDGSEGSTDDIDDDGR